MALAIFQMITYCTYCSAEKDYSEMTLPAIERYESSRITSVYNKAIEEGVGFVILSGKYGILNTQQSIDYYDHLLVTSELEQHASLIATQFKTKGITKLVFFTESVSKDPNVKPYIDCIKQGAAKSEVALEIRELA